MKSILPLGLLTAVALSTMALAAQAAELKLARFFGVCDEKSTDIAAQNGEACIIETIIRNFSEQDNGITVTEMPADWESYYGQLKTWMVGGNPPDVFVMHEHRIMEFAGIGALAEITDQDYADAGIDLSDFSDRAIDAITFQDKKWGVPLDFHAYLWHVNMDLMEQAGLVEDGEPVLPDSPEQMLEHARMVKEATGVNYLTTFFSTGPGAMRTFVALMAQQGVDPYSSDGTVNLDSDAGRKTLVTMRSLGDAGYANLKVPMDQVRNEFLSGKAAILIDGTWRVDANNALIGKEGIALKNYHVASQPQLFSTSAAWADTHMWAIPSKIKNEDPEKFKAAMKLLAFINENGIHWARTGHLPVRRSVLQSPELAAMPYRDGYADTADIAYYMQPSPKYSAIQDAIGRNLVEYFQNDKSLDATVEDMQESVEDEM